MSMKIFVERLREQAQNLGQAAHLEGPAPLPTPVCIERRFQGFLAERRTVITVPVLRFCCQTPAITHTVTLNRLGGWVNGGARSPKEQSAQNLKEVSLR